MPESLPFINGQPTFLARLGYDVRVVSAGGERAATFAARQGVRHYALPLTRRMSPARDFICLLRMYGLFVRLKPVIVHANTPKASLTGMLAAWLARVPVRIYEIHGFPFESRQGLVRTALIWFEQLACRLATRVLAVSASVRQVALAEGIAPPTKVMVLHHGS